MGGPTPRWRIVACGLARAVAMLLPNCGSKKAGHDRWRGCINLPMTATAFRFMLLYQDEGYP